MAARSATARRPRRRSFYVLVLLLALVTACSGSDDSASSPTIPSPDATEPAEPTPTPEPPTATTEPTPKPEPPTATTEPVATLGPTTAPILPLPGVNAIGDLAAAAPGSFVTAKADRGFLLDDGTGYIVPVYDVPNGPPRVLVDRNTIDGVELDFPLRNPTVFDQPLVLRVIAGEPGDEWLLVQAPVRPHRQHVWVRADDFVHGQSDIRIEVDLGRNGHFALFDNEVELISNGVVYGRDSRPTVLHDTYVEQAFEGARLSPAYGTYIVTIASYSEALGTFGGGGLPGQSLHGTNQPELVGQRVSSGGIRVPNEVIDFVYAQPSLIGASVIIYDSSGIGREAAIALQRNAPWTPAKTIALDETNLPAVPVPSYS